MLTDQTIAQIARDAHIKFALQAGDTPSAEMIFARAIEAAVRAEADKDAARFRHIAPMFRAFSLYTNGQHSWTLGHGIGALRGPSFAEAVDNSMAANRKAALEREGKE